VFVIDDLIDEIIETSVSYMEVYIRVHSLHKDRKEFYRLMHKARELWLSKQSIDKIAPML
jgi:hypothetical protein